MGVNVHEETRIFSGVLMKVNVLLEASTFEEKFGKLPPPTVASFPSLFPRKSPPSPPPPPFHSLLLITLPLLPFLDLFRVPRQKVVPPFCDPAPDCNGGSFPPGLCSSAFSFCCSTLLLVEAPALWLPEDAEKKTSFREEVGISEEEAVDVMFGVEGEEKAKLVEVKTDLLLVVFAPVMKISFRGEAASVEALVLENTVVDGIDEDGGKFASLDPLICPHTLRFVLLL